MKIAFILPLFALALGGCVSARSPLDRPSSNHITAGEVGTLAVGTGAGAVAGHALTHNNTGTAIGGLVGLAGTAIVNNVTDANRQRELAEAEAHGERKAAADMFDQMWDKEAREPTKNGKGAGAASSDTIEYPAGTYEGVKYAPRQSDAPGFSEPQR